MRDFVKNNYDEGITDLKIIKNISGIKQTFADHAAVLLGDDDNYQRIIQRKRKRKNPDATIPPELEKMETWDYSSNSFRNVEEIYKEVTGANF